MVLTILGWFWIIAGVVYLLNPEKLKNQMKKKTNKQLKKIFFVLAVFLGILLINATLGVPGLLAKVLLVFGFIAILKGIYFLKAQSAEKIIEWFLNQPISFYRGWAIGLITFGALILSV